MRRLRRVTISALVSEGHEAEFEQVVGTFINELINTVQTDDIEVVAFSFQDAEDEGEDPGSDA